MKTQPIIASLLIISLVLITLIPQTSAAGVSSSYWSRNPLKLAPGETQDVSFGLQNMVGDEDITFIVGLENNGGDIANLIQEKKEYYVPVGSKDEVSIPVRVIVPKDAEIGSTYEVSILLQQTAVGEGGAVQLATAISSGFPVEIVEDGDSVQYNLAEEEEKKKARENLIYFFTVFGMVVLMIVVFGLSRKRRKSK